MIKLLLEQYAKTKLLKLPKEFSAPKEIKLEEIGIPLSKINKENFYGLCDLEYKDILESQLYLFPETKINFIISIDKVFKPVEKIEQLVDSKIYEMPAFIANGYWRDDLNDKAKEDRDNTYAGLQATIGLMIDCIKEDKPENAKFVYVGNKLGKDKMLDLLDRCPKGFLPIYNLGFNIIVER